MEPRVDGAVDVQPEVDAAVVPDSAVDVEVDASPEADTSPEVDAEVDVSPEVDAGLDLDAAVDATPEADAEVDASLEVDAEVDVSPEVDADLDLDAAVDANAEADAVVDATPAADIEVDASPEADTAVDAVVDASQQPDAEPDASPVVDAAPEPDAAVDVGPELDAAVDSAHAHPCDAEGDACTACNGDEFGPPCNGCPAGVVVPNGWVCIPPGEGMVGEPDALTACAREDGCRLGSATSSMPNAHPVWISRPYLMRSTEFTWDELSPAWELDLPVERPADGRLPASHLTWYDAARICNALSEDEGLEPCYTFGVVPDIVALPAGFEPPPQANPIVTFHGVACTGYRLPTAAEWEYAARAGDSEPTPIGPLRWREGNPGQELARAFDPVFWHSGNAVDLQRVGQKPDEAHRHRWGLFDMLGNALEWTQGEAMPNGGGFSPDRVVVDPHGKPEIIWENPDIVLKGGSRGFDNYLLRYASIFPRPPGYRYSHVGFRPVRTLPGTAIQPALERLEPPYDDIGRMCPLPDPSREPVVCQGQAAHPCNGCPAGIEVPHGWVCIPPQNATIGRQSPTECTPAECCPDYGEEPMREVELTRAYLMKATEMTQAEMYATLGVNSSGLSTCGADCPADSVTIPEMMLALNALSEAEGLEPCYDIDLHACVNRVHTWQSDESGAYLRGDNGHPIPVLAPNGGEDLSAGIPWRPGRQEEVECERAAQAAIAHYADCTGYRLPTEAEWEVAARGVGEHAASATYAGDLSFEPDGRNVSALDTIAWYVGNADIDYPLGYRRRPVVGGGDGDSGEVCGGDVPPKIVGMQPVGLLQPNRYGLCDMLGNVREVTWDHEVPPGGLPRVDPVGLVPGLDQHWDAPMTWRGGTASDFTQRLRAANRIANPSTTSRLTLQGFRPVRTVWWPEPEPEPEPGPDPEPEPEPEVPAGVMDPADPCNEIGARCTRCLGDEIAPPCNGCPAGVDVPDGWVCIPPGEFLAGEPSPSDACEWPGGCRIGSANRSLEHAHDVWLTRPYLMQATEMTWRDWPDEVERDRNWPRGADDEPVPGIDWYEAANAANALSLRDGLTECYVFEDTPRQNRPVVRYLGADCVGYRLPTHAEWEYAARAGDPRPTPAGPLRMEHGPGSPLAEEIDAVLWSSDNADVVQPVGQRPLRLADNGEVIAGNRWGLYDMLGNAGEWTQGEALFNDGGFALGRLLVDPHAEPHDVWEKTDIVHLTGVDYARFFLRFSARFARPPGFSVTSTGFRLARTVPTLRLHPPAERMSPPPDRDDRLCPLPDADVPPVVCQGEEDFPCNGCPAGIEVPHGWACIPPGDARIGELADDERAVAECEPDACCGLVASSRYVELSRAYLIKTTEMTQGELFDRAGFNPTPYSTCGGDCPATILTILEMMDTLNRMSEAEGLEPCYRLEACENIIDGTRIPWKAGRQARAECLFATYAARDHYANCSGYRLPTEAEWEVAVRGRGEHSDAATYNGNLVFLPQEDGLGDGPSTLNVPVLDDIAWYVGNAWLEYPIGWLSEAATGYASDWVCRGETDALVGIKPVGMKLPNDFGLCDMLGNAYEVTFDHVGRRPPGLPVGPDGLPITPAERVDDIGRDPVGFASQGRWQHWNADAKLSGGSFNSAASQLRATGHVQGSSAAYRVGSIGFRPVRTVWADPASREPPRWLEPCADVDGPCIICGGQEDTAPPCNGCPAGVAVPEGWVCVPPGYFIMGQNDPDHECVDPDGNPVDACKGPADGFGEPPHPVRLSRAYLIREYETTRARWSFGEDDGADADRPKTGASVHEVVRYLNERSAAEGLEPCYVIGEPEDGNGPPSVRFLGADCIGYRLPTEAEWAYAARARETGATQGGPLVVSLVPEGDDAFWVAEDVDDFAWAGHQALRGQVQPVGQLAPNPWGLYDMIGNAAEFVNDEYSSNYGGFPGYAAIDTPVSGGPAVDPFAEPSTWRAASTVEGDCTDGRRSIGYRMVKGGRLVRGTGLRFAARTRVCPDAANSEYGFREVRTVPGNWPVILPDEPSAPAPVLCPAPTGDPARDTAPCNGCPEHTRVPPGFVCVPAGAAVIGRTRPEDECLPLECCPGEVNEQAIEVEFTYPMLVKDTVVTQSEMYRLTGNNGSNDNGCGPDCPTREAPYWMMAYANALSREEGLEPCYELCPGAVDDSGALLNRPQDLDFDCASAGMAPDLDADYMACSGYRLPTDVEWEYFARAGTIESTPNGWLALEDDGLCVEARDGMLDDVAWTVTNSHIDSPTLSRLYPRTTERHPENRPQPVGQLRPNRWGVYDVLGNVHERVWDHWDETVEGGIDPQPFIREGVGVHWAVPGVLRGGNFTEPAVRHRFADRREAEIRTGFRVVRTLSPTPPAE